MNKMYRTFTGSDTLVFIMLPNCEPICLGSISTLSYSIYRHKKPVALLGRVNVAGYTRGLRIAAGTIIFTMINQHWVNELKDRIPELKQYPNLKADELPLFDLMIVCANEYGATVNGFIYGIDVTDEAQKLSVEEMFSESVNSFVARDITLFEEGVVGGVDAINYETSIYIGKENKIKKSLILNQVQGALSDLGYGVRNTGVYDEDTRNAIKSYQKDKGLDNTGELDSVTANSITNSNHHKEVTVSDTAGVSIYDQTDEDKKQTGSYFKGDKVKLLGESGSFYKTAKGYVKKEALDVKSIEFISKHKEGKYNVTINELANGKYNVTARAKNDTTVKVSVVSYKGKKSEIVTKNIHVAKGDTSISTKDVIDGFLYSQVLQGTPTYCEVMFSSGNETYKWRFSLNGEKNM